MYGEGIYEGCFVDLGVQYNILNKSGAWYSYGDQRIGQGRENTKTFLKEHPDMAADVEAKIRAAAGLPADGKPVQAQATAQEPEELVMTPEADGDHVE